MAKLSLDPLAIVRVQGRGKDCIILSSLYCISWYPHLQISLPLPVIPCSQGREKDYIILSCVRSNEHQVRTQALRTPPAMRTRALPATGCCCARSWSASLYRLQPFLYTVHRTILPAKTCRALASWRTRAA